MRTFIEWSAVILVVGFVGSAVVAGIIDGIRGKGRDR